MARYIALLRGINVGKAKQVPMAALKTACESIGWRRVMTVLRSGSVVFDTDAVPSAASLEVELRQVAGVSARVLILSAPEFSQLTSANPLTEPGRDGSRLFTTFLENDVGDIQVPDAAALAPELFALGTRAVYQWFPDGSTSTKVPRSFWSQLPGVQTARNENTVQKILTLLSEES